MAFCGKCGKEVAENTKFCAECEAAVETSIPASAPADNAAVPAPEAPANSDGYVPDKKDAEDNKLMALLSYIGPLCIVPLVTGDYKKSPFVHFHVNQGLVLFLSSVIWSIAQWPVYMVLRTIKMGLLSPLFSLLSLAFLILAIIGIVSALNGQAKELPVIGKIKILKK